MKLLMIKITSVLLVMLLCVYGFLGWQCLYRLQTQIQREEARQPVLRTALQEVKANRETFLRKVHAACGTGASAVVRANTSVVTGLFRDPEVKKIAVNYLGSGYATVMDGLLKNELKHRAASDVRTKIHELEVRQSLLSHQLVGRAGSGGPGLKEERRVIAERLDLLRENEQVLLKQKEAGAGLWLVALEETIADRMDVLLRNADELKKLQDRQRSFAIWPLSCFIEKRSE